MDDNTGYGPWRTASEPTHCDSCQQPLETGDRIQTGPDGEQLGECCGLFSPSAVARPVGRSTQLTLDQEMRLVAATVHLDRLLDAARHTQAAAGDRKQYLTRLAAVRDAAHQLSPAERADALLCAVIALSKRGWTGTDFLHLEASDGA